MENEPISNEKRNKAKDKKKARKGHPYRKSYHQDNKAPLNRCQQTVNHRLRCQTCEEMFYSLEEAQKHSIETQHHDYLELEGHVGVCIG
jgi:hypothetical protein